jgi:primosomal protein N' (replication factor Y)
VSLTFHQSSQRLLCHYCGFSLPVPQVCPVCHSPYIKFFGVGTQRVEEEMQRRFPGVSTLRMDNDTTRSRDAHQILLDRFRAGEAQVLIGTQMIAKGLDFPRVTLVGIVAADALLRLPDYKAAERAFQLLTQVAGRAGRAGDPGRVVLQTYDPENPVIKAASRQDYRAFYEMEMRKRRRGMFPPYTTILRLTCSARDEESAACAARQVRELMEQFLNRRAYLRRLLVSLSTGPAPVSRIMDRYRWQTQLILIDREPAQEAAGRMSELAQAMPQAVEARLEVNPTGF